MTFYIVCTSLNSFYVHINQSRLKRDSTKETGLCQPVTMSKLNSNDCRRLNILFWVSKWNASADLSMQNKHFIKLKLLEKLQTEFHNIWHEALGFYLIKLWQIHTVQNQNTTFNENISCTTVHFLYR